MVDEGKLGFFRIAIYRFPKICQLWGVSIPKIVNISLALEGLFC